MLTQVSEQGDIVSSVGRNRTSYSELKVDGVGLNARAGQVAGIKIGFEAWIQTKEKRLSREAGHFPFRLPSFGKAVSAVGNTNSRRKSKRNAGSSTSLPTKQKSSNSSSPAAQVDFPLTIESQTVVSRSHIQEGLGSIVFLFV